VSREKLKAKLKSPDSLRFSDFCKIMIEFGFEFKRSKGSHRIYAHEAGKYTISVQDRNGMAKGYQVRQFIDYLKRMGEI